MLTSVIEAKFRKQYPYPTREGVEVLRKLNKQFTNHYFTFYFYGACPDTSFYKNKRPVANAGRGNCLFLSIVDQVRAKLGVDHEELRRLTCDFITENLEPLSFVFNQSKQELSKHVTELYRNGTYGSSEAIYALSCLLNCTIKVFLKDDERAIVFYPNPSYRKLLKLKHSTIYILYSQKYQHYEALQ